MWFKKKSVLQAEGHYDTEKSVDGSTDMRTTWKGYDNNNTSSIKYSGPPSAADAGNYFYLPALGYYDDGQVLGVGNYGYYWSSSAYPSNSNLAYALGFGYGTVGVSYFARGLGYRVGGFE